LVKPQSLNLFWITIPLQIDLLSYWGFTWLFRSR